MGQKQSETAPAQGQPAGHRRLGPARMTNGAPVSCATWQLSLVAAALLTRPLHWIVMVPP